MNLLIVEDEPRLRTNLAHDIPWEDHGIEVAGLAASGEEALQMFDRKKPDIMLLDIQMTGMNGLDLARRISAKDRLVKLIVLSGHDNFEYAREAMELGITKYLLKPAGDKEILEAVLQAAEELREQLDRLHHESLLREKWNEHLPYLRESFLANWLQGKNSPQEIETRSRDLMLDIARGKKYAVAIVDMDPPFGEEAESLDTDNSQLQMSLKYICQENVDKGTEWVTIDSYGSTVIVFTADETCGREAFVHHVNASVGKLLGIVGECLKSSASAGISGISDKPADLHKLYEQAREALRKRIVYGNAIAVTYQDRFEPKPIVTFYPDLERELEIAIDTGNSAKCAEALGELWRLIMETSDSVDEADEGLLYFTSLFVRLIHQRGCSVREVAGADLPYLQNLRLFSTKDQVYDCLNRILRNFIEHLEQKRGAAGHRMVLAVLEMIENGMQEELSLHTVSERLFINPSYLSRLFKKETGKSFSTYVLERKMNQAKEALLRGAKVYEAAGSVGYRDVSYFTKVFRKFWGVTPKEMAKQP